MGHKKNRTRQSYAVLNPSYATGGAISAEVLAFTWVNPDLENHFLGEM
jgi:hypothetical protein